MNFDQRSGAQHPNAGQNTQQTVVGEDYSETKTYIRNDFEELHNIVLQNVFKKFHYGH
jgi:hypothetical protein